MDINIVFVNNMQICLFLGIFSFGKMFLKLIVFFSFIFDLNSLIIYQRVIIIIMLTTKMYYINYFQMYVIYTNILIRK